MKTKFISMLVLFIVLVLTACNASSGPGKGSQSTPQPFPTLNGPSGTVINKSAESGSIASRFQLEVDSARRLDHRL